MGRPIRVLTLSLVLAMTAAKTIAASGGMTVEINDSKRVTLYGAATNVIVSDPAVADVTLVDTHSIVLVGRGYGSTHIEVLDGVGHILFDRRVTVVAPQDGRVTLYHGAVAADYSCSPRCQLAAASNSTTGGASGANPSQGSQAAASQP